MCCYTDDFRTLGRGNYNVVNKKAKGKRNISIWSRFPNKQLSEKGWPLDPRSHWASAPELGQGPPVRPWPAPDQRYHRRKHLPNCLGGTSYSYEHSAGAPHNNPIVVVPVL